MRKIVTKEQKDKTAKKNQLIIGIVLIGLMVLSTLGYALSGRGESSVIKKIDYNGIEFSLDNSGYWKFNVQGKDFSTKYNPEETEYILFLNDLSISDYSKKPLYFIGDFQEPNYEISRNLGSFVLRMQEACISEKDCKNNLPVKNCSVDNIIVIREASNGSEKENIYQQENCIFINADLGNQTRYADKFLFDILGVS